MTEPQRLSETTGDGYDVFLLHDLVLLESLEGEMRDVSTLSRNWTFETFRTDTTVKLFEGLDGVLEVGHELSGQVGETDADLIAALEGAQWIIDLGDNWDEDGAVGYEPETLDRAKTLLLEMAARFGNEFSAPLAVPDINPADDGSIDLFWDGTRSILINVPASQNDPTFSFRGPGGDGDLFGTFVGQNQGYLLDLLSMHAPG